MDSSSSAEPPFQETYKALLEGNSIDDHAVADKELVEECELPLIDLSMLSLGELEREECKRKIANASQEWGFFQVVNHGISPEILEKMRYEQVNAFKKPFHEKELCFPVGTYRWGTPSATCLRQLSWSEAFHVPLIDIPNLGTGLTSLR